MKRCYICNSTEHDNYNTSKITSWFYVREEIRCNICQELIDNDLLEHDPEFEFLDEREQEFVLETGIIKKENDEEIE